MPLDQLQLNFNPESLKLLNVIIGLIMFGLALDLKLEDFKRIAAAPIPPLIGLIGQFILLPALSFLWTLVLKPPPSIALGMILIAAGPGGMALVAAWWGIWHLISGLTVALMWSKRPV